MTINRKTVKTTTVMTSARGAALTVGELASFVAECHEAGIPDDSACIGQADARKQGVNGDLYNVRVDLHRHLPVDG